MNRQTTQNPRPNPLQSRRDIGIRLRVLWMQADMTGKALAELLGCHPAKISRIENGTATPSVTDIRTWCVATSADDQAEDLVATAVAAESAYATWRNEQRIGLVRLQDVMDDLYARTSRLHSYESRVVPGLLQTEDYAAEILGRLQARRGGPDDAREAAVARHGHRRVLHGECTFTFLIEESVLRSRIAADEVMSAQFDQLIEDSRLPRVSIGVIPLDVHRAQWPTESFYAYDEELIRVQLISGRWTAATPGDIGEYLTVFQELSAIAVFGDDARELITKASAL